MLAQRLVPTGRVTSTWLFSRYISFRFVLSFQCTECDITLSFLLPTPLIPKTNRRMLFTSVSRKVPLRQSSTPAFSLRVLPKVLVLVSDELQMLSRRHRGQTDIHFFYLYILSNDYVILGWVNLITVKLHHFEGLTYSGLRLREVP